MAEPAVRDERLDDPVRLHRVAARQKAGTPLTFPLRGKGFDAGEMHPIDQFVGKSQPRADFLRDGR